MFPGDRKQLVLLPNEIKQLPSFKVRDNSYQIAGEK
jgi:hypothetical protein